jgi:hypothetical protein
MNAKKSKRGQTTPAIPATPPGGFQARILPQWMYSDPAVVVERLEGTERAALERRQASMREPPRPLPRPELSPVSPGTIRLIKRAHIRELMAAVKKKGRAC